MELERLAESILKLQSFQLIDIDALSDGEALDLAKNMMVYVSVITEAMGEKLKEVNDICAPLRLNDSETPVEVIKRLIRKEIEGSLRMKPHEFQGRPDRWCEVCNLPDRNPIHLSRDDRIVFCVCCERIMAGDLFRHFGDCEVVGELQKSRSHYFYAIEVSFRQSDLDQRSDIRPRVHGIVHMRKAEYESPYG